MARSSVQCTTIMMAIRAVRHQKCKNFYRARMANVQDQLVRLCDYASLSFVAQFTKTTDIQKVYPAGTYAQKHLQ